MKTHLCAALAALILISGGCSGALGPDDLRSGDLKGVVIRKSRTEGDYFIHVRLASGDQATEEVTADAYRMVGEGDSHPLSETAAEPQGSEEIDEETAKEGDPGAFKKPEDDEESGD